MENKAIFLDRDGIINEDLGYVYKIEDFQFKSEIFEILFYLQNLGYKLFIITNQSGIARGYYTQNDFLKLNSWMIEQFKKKNIIISQVEFCPHGPNDNCNCRKPKTGMIDAITKNYSFDLNQSWLLGDKISDIECAQKSKIKNKILVSNEHVLIEDLNFHQIATLNFQILKNIIHN